jgi:hypothetical protein
MEKKPTPEKIETKLLNILIPEDLMERIQTICAEKDMTVQDFVTDSIIEKIGLAYKERRKKPRL